MNSACDRVTEKLASWLKSTPTWTQELSYNFIAPNRCSANPLIFSNTSCCPQPKISSIWVANAPTACPWSRKTKNKQGLNADALRRNPAFLTEGSEFSKWRFKERRKATGASFSPNAGALSFRALFLLSGSHSNGACKKTSRSNPSAGKNAFLISRLRNFHMRMALMEIT